MQTQRIKALPHQAPHWQAEVRALLRPYDFHADKEQLLSLLEQGGRAYSAWWPQQYPEIE